MFGFLGMHYNFIINELIPLLYQFRNIISTINYQITLFIIRILQINFYSNIKISKLRANNPITNLKLNKIKQQTSEYMKYNLRYKKQQIPEWSQCYLRYDYLQKIARVMKDCVRERLALDIIIKSGYQCEIKVQQVLQVKEIPIPQFQLNKFKQYYQFFYETSVWANDMFLEALRRNLELYKKFTKWKYCEIESNYLVACRFNVLGGPSDPSIKSKNFKRYLENLSVESSYLARMVQSNIQAQVRILGKHTFYACKVFPTPARSCQSEITIIQCDDLKRKIDRLYFKTNNKPKQKSQARLQRLAQPPYVNKFNTLFIGLLVGTIITIIVFMIIILTRSNITLQSDPIFNTDFPLWRGLALLFFYIWGLGLDMYYFEKYNITYKIIFENDQQDMPTSADFFKIAGVFSTFFVITFIIYTLEIADLLQTGNLAPQWLPLFVWVSFILFLINPFPILYYDGRKLFFKTLYKIVISICTPSTLISVWGVANAITLLNAFRDVVYTICFYTTLQLPLPFEQQQMQGNTCRPVASQARFIYAIFIYSLRVVQCLRNAICNNKIKTEYLNAFRFSLICLTAILAYLFQQNSQKHILPAWITFAAISTLFSFFWDVRMAWDLFHKDSINKYLRDQLIFPKINYYCWIVINFILRLVWTLNISPNIIRDLIGSVELLVLIFGFLEIIRRCIWNLIRMELQQTRNNAALNSMPKDHTLRDQKIKQYVESNKSKLSVQSAQSLYQTQKHILISNQQTIHDFKKQKQEVINSIKQLRAFFQQQDKQVEKSRKEVHKNTKAYSSIQKALFKAREQIKKN